MADNITNPTFTVEITDSGSKNVTEKVHVSMNGNTIVMTLNSGLKWYGTAPRARQIVNGTQLWLKNFVYSTDSKTATCDLTSILSLYNESEPIMIDGYKTVSKDSTYLDENLVEHTTLSANNVNSTTATLTADEGYVFDPDNPPTADNWANAVSGYKAKEVGVLSDDNKVATFSMSEFNRVKYYPVQFKGSVKLDLEQTITNNIENTTYAVNDTEIVITANDGYKFETAPQGYNDLAPLMDRDFIDFTLSEDGKTATCLRSLLHATDTDEYDISLSGTVVEDVPDTYNVVNNVSHSTYEVTGDVLKLYADNGWKFNGKPTVQQTQGGTIGLVSYKANLSADSKTATLDLSATTIPYVKGKQITVSGNTVEDFERVFDNQIEHTTFSVNGNTVVITADTGYKFETEPLVSLLYSGAPLNERVAVYATLSADGKTATADISEFGNYNPTTFTGSVVADVVYRDFYGTINVYEVTNDNLKSFAKKRFYEANKDLGNYVVKLFRLFAPVGETRSAVITCGDINTNIQAQTPVEDRQVLDFGTVTVPFHNNDSTDYNADIQMFLPFVGFVKLDTSYIGKPVNLTYEVNVITGEAVARLSYDGNVFAVYEGEVSTAILYKTSNVNVIGNIGFNSKFLYGLEPYVKVLWKQSKNEYEHNSDCERVVIGSVTGFAKITEPTDISAEQMTADEKTMIINQLNTGVYVEQQS